VHEYSFNHLVYINSRSDRISSRHQCLSSEQKLQGKLELPRSSSDRRNGAGVGVRSAAAIQCAQRGRLEIEIGVVQDIEEFRTKLQSGRLRDPGVFRQIDIQSRVAG